MIAIPITNIDQLKQAEKLADIIEIRLDYLKNIPKTITSKKPLIITNRSYKEGGKRKQAEKSRINTLKTFLGKALYLDIEASTSKATIRSFIKNKKKSKIIISYHNFKETPKNIESIYNNIKKLKPDIIKIVTTAKSSIDNLKILNLLAKARAEKQKLIAFCMGEKGKTTRVLAIPFGSYLTFASLKQKTAPGQFSVAEYKKLRGVLKC